MDIPIAVLIFVVTLILTITQFHWIWLVLCIVSVLWLLVRAGGSSGFGNAMDFFDL